MRLALAVLLGLAGCALPVDPCPLPVRDHPEVWTAIPVTTPAGDVVAWAYVCTGHP